MNYQKSFQIITILTFILSSSLYAQQVTFSNWFPASDQRDRGFIKTTIFRPGQQPITNTPIVPATLNLRQNEVFRGEAVDQGEFGPGGYFCVWNLKPSSMSNSTAMNSRHISKWHLKYDGSDELVAIPEFSRIRDVGYSPGFTTRSYTMLLRQCMLTIRGRIEEPPFGNGSEFIVAPNIGFIENEPFSATAIDSVQNNGTWYFFDRWIDTTVENPTPKNLTRPITNQNANRQISALYRRKRVITLEGNSNDNGILLNELHYGVRFEQNITLTANAKVTDNFGRVHYFQKWSDGDTSRIKTFSNVTTDDTVTAEYKGFRLSNIPDLAGKSGGSRTVAIDATNSNYWYQVYESNNAIWLSYSTNAGASWQPEVKLGDGKNPSIASGGVVWVNGGINFRTVGFQDGNLNLGSIWSSSAHNALQPFLFVDPIPDAHPCIAHKFESDGSSSWYIVYEHRLRQGLTAPATYPNTELRLIRLGWTSSGFGVKSLHTIPNSFYTQSYLLLYPAIATDNSSNPNVNTPATIVWQNYVPTVSDGIKVCEANLVSGSLVFGAQHTFAAGQSSTIQYQKPTIVLDGANHRHIAWQALDHSHPYGARTVILYKVLPTWNDPSQPLTKFLYYDSKATPSIGFANGTVSLVWDYSGGTCFGATRSTSGTWGSWQSFFGEAPNLMQTGAKQIAHAKANGGLFDVKLTSLSGGGGSAQERGLSGGGKGNGVQAVTNSGSGGNDNGGESISVKARTSALLFKENETLVKTAWLDLTLADVGLNGSSRTGLTYHDLGANLLPDTLALSPSNVFSLLKSRKFSRADTINQVSATVKVHSKSLYDLTQNNPVQLAVELVNATTGSSIALSQTALVTASDTAKEIHFTMNLPTGQSGTEVEMRVKVLGFAIQPSHKASALNEIELVSGAGGAAIVNRVGGQAAQTQSVGSVPTKFALHQNYPNPFNPVAVIRYELPSNAMVKLQVFDVLGRVVATVVNERKEAGIYEAMFNASSLSSGTYFYRLEARSSGSQAGSFVETKKMVLVK